MVEPLMAEDGGLLRMVEPLMAEDGGAMSRQERIWRIGAG